MDGLEKGFSGARPTRVRYQVLAGLSVLALITYIDRVCIMQVQDDIRRDLSLTDGQMGKVFAAFTLSYAICEVPAGWWGDVVGARRVLTRIVLCWSLFTALTGCVVNVSWLDIAGPWGVLASGFWMMVLVRFLFGAGEAGAYPNITRAMSRWFPMRERGMCQGVIWAASRVGGSIAPLLIGWLNMGIAAAAPFVPLIGGIAPWRLSFVAFSLLGVAWCLWFYPWFRDNPRDKSTVNAGEVELIESDRSTAGDGHAAVPWLRLIAGPNIWFLCLMYACGAYSWYIYITFLPRFISTTYGESHGLMRGGSAEGWFNFLSGLPLLLGAIGCFAGGPFTDRLIRRIGLRWGRSLTGIWGCLGGAGLLALAIQFESPWVVLSLIGLSSLVKDMNMPASWAVCVDVGGKYAGTISGVMNMMGNLGGVAAPWVMGDMVEFYGTAPAVWHYIFCMFAAVHVLGAVFWLGVNATEPLLVETDADNGNGVEGGHKSGLPYPDKPK